MTVTPIRLDTRRDKRGTVLSLEFYKQFGLSIVDAVVHTTKKGERRGGHYHPKEDGKIEIFVPLLGAAKLIWHDRTTPDETHEEIMRPIFQNGNVIYRVSPETCHQVIGESESEFMMLEASSAIYVGKPDPDCEHGLKISR